MFRASGTIQPSHCPCIICGQQNILPFEVEINCTIYIKIEFACDREYSFHSFKTVNYESRGVQIFQKYCSHVKFQRAKIDYMTLFLF